MQYLRYRILLLMAVAESSLLGLFILNQILRGITEVNPLYLYSEISENR